MSKLGELGDILNGSSIPKSGGSFPAYGGNGVISYVERYNYPANTIIIGRVGANCGEVAFSKKDCWITDNALAFCPSDEVDPYYVYLLLSALKLNQYHIGSSQPLLTQSIIKEISFPYERDKRKQHNISRTIRLIDDLIETNTTLSSTLEEAAKTLYDYWFTQFDFPNEEGKPYRSSGGKMVWNEELKREIPEGWEVDTLRNKYKLSRGISYSSKDIETNSGIPMLNLACVSTERKYRDGELKYFSGNIADDKFANEGDLLIASTDLTRNADIVGCPILVPNDGINYTYSMDLVKLIPNKAFFDSFYLSMALQTTSYHNYIKKWASGTNVLHLNLDGLAWYKTCIPPITLQKQFGVIIKQIHANNGRILAENRSLSSLRDYLLPLLMNGQVTIED